MYSFPPAPLTPILFVPSSTHNPHTCCSSCSKNEDSSGTGVSHGSFTLYEWLDGSLRVVVRIWLHGLLERQELSELLLWESLLRKGERLSGCLWSKALPHKFLFNLLGAESLLCKLLYQ